MRFGGLQKHSLIDYPGHISCVIFLTGCNFRCPYCHNPDLSMGKVDPRLDEESLFAFLEARRIFLDGVVISGGEPCIQPGLQDFCEKIKTLGFHLKLDTNGSRPDVLRNLIRGGVIDYAAMDVKTAPERYAPLSGAPVDPETIRKSIRLIKNDMPDHEFRTTCAKPFINPDTIQAILDEIDGASLYALQRFRNKRVLDPEYQREGLALSDTDLEAFKRIAEGRVRRCILR